MVVFLHSRKIGCEHVSTVVMVVVMMMMVRVRRGGPPTDVDVVVVSFDNHNVVGVL